MGGILAVTRAIGDAFLKPFVTGTPETSTTRCCSGDVLVLGSDGLWDFVPAALVAQTVRDAQARDGATWCPARVALALARAALERGGDDNVTVIVADVARFR